MPAFAPKQNRHQKAASSNPAPRSAHGPSQVTAHPPVAGQIQAKLTINAPGDEFEQAADRIADQVMRMPAPQLRRACACGGECPRCQTEQPTQGHERLHTKHVGSGGLGQTAVPPIVHEVLRSPGQPLGPEVRAFMEPRFGHDFSQVRVHTDLSAQQSALEVSANAYTVAHDIVFAPGRFAPQSSEGRRLLAHELTHVVQQSGSDSTSANQPAAQSDPRRQRDAPGKPDMVATSAFRPVLQRDMGFEFQLRDNTIITNKRRKFPRKAGKFFHKVPPTDKHGLELQTDNGSVMEFETHHFQKWSDLRAQIAAAVDVVQEIKKDPKAFPFNQEKRFRTQGLLGKGENLEVDVADPAFLADIQSTEGIALNQYQSLLKEHERDPTKFVDPVLRDAQDIVDAAAKTSKGIKAGANVDNLRSFLQIITNYIHRGREELWDKSDPGVVKATFRLMMRVDFSSVYRKLLTADEKTLFKEILKSNAIPKKLGIAPADPFFKAGYWGDLGGGVHGFFEGGKVTALALNGKIHDCSATTKTPGIDSRMCGQKVAGTNISVGSWLSSIANSTKDELSPASHGSVSMGQFPVSTKGTEKDLVVLEVRGTTARNRTQPASKWVDYADEVFSQAAACRPRSGTGTELDYDGTKKFDPKNCP